MGRIFRGTVQSFSFDSESSSKYDSILKDLLKFDSQGGSIDEEAFVDELRKMHNMDTSPTIVHIKKHPVVNGKDIFGKYNPKDNKIYIYDDMNVDICVYVNTMAHEFQYASDYTKRKDMNDMKEPIAYENGDEAQYACEKKVVAEHAKQEKNDAKFYSRFGVMHCNQSSCVDIDSDNLDR